MKFPDASFSPLFDAVVRVEAVRPDPGANTPGGTCTIRGGFRACVMPLADEEPVVESASASRRKRWSVLIARKGRDSWSSAAVGSDPQIGDRVTLEDGCTASVTHVSTVVDTWYELEVRK